MDDVAGYRGSTLSSLPPRRSTISSKPAAAVPGTGSLTYGSSAPSSSSAAGGGPATTSPSSSPFLRDRQVHHQHHHHHHHLNSNSSSSHQEGCSSSSAGLQAATNNSMTASSSAASAASSAEAPSGADTLTSSGKPRSHNNHNHHHHHHHHHHHRRKGRSKSSTRYVDAEKPKKKVLGNASSLMSIPNTVKLSMLNSGFISIKEEDGKVLSSLPKRPINKETFLKICEERRKFPVLYKVEFQIACKNEGHACRHATKVVNKDKNQNNRVIPYDYNRVVLEPAKDFPGDYVNASYVDSLLKPNAYIVAQGPLEGTVGDFWRMIWQERISVIIMLTKTFDFIKVMCEQYWPGDGKIQSYGGYTVRVESEQSLANFTIRTIKIWKQDSTEAEARRVLQFHYTEWPCHTGPFPTALLDFRRRVRQIISEKPEFGTGETLVHCNDGGGRAGVYLQVDSNLELLEEDGLLDVFGYLKKLRNSRKGLVETVEQLKFIYDTLEEYVICRKTWFPVSELSQRLKHKSIRDPLTKINEYQREFLLICKQTPRFSIGDCAGGHRGDNRDKNRDVLVIPPDNFRPYLTSFQGNTHTDYINAVFVDGYRQSKGYIVTEWPIPFTISYLWSLVYDYDASAVVVLANPEPSTQYPQFWPDSSRSKKYGPVFTIDHMSHNHYNNIKSWIFRINKKIVSLTELMAGVKAEPKKCQLFQLTCWPMEHKVPTSTNSLVELMNMVERWRARSDYGPVVVVSPDGRSRAGVYCAANACIEQVIQYGEVDVFTAVKTVRRHRPQMIENMTEYKYCYDVVLHYVLHYLNKEAAAKKPPAGSAAGDTTTVTPVLKPVVQP